MTLNKIYLFTFIKINKYNLYYFMQNYFFYKVTGIYLKIINLFIILLISQ